MTARHALLGAILALPIALLTLAVPAGERAGALSATLPALAGLVLLDLPLRRRVGDGTAFWTLVLAVYGTGLFPLLAHAPDARRATAFLAGALAVLALRAGATTGARMAGFALALLVVGLALGPWRFDAPGIARGLFGSRNGLLFRTPLLWACLAGLAVLWRREGRAAAALAATGALPFLLAPFAPGAAVEVALPALLTGLAVGLDALCRLLARRPAWALAPAVPLLALSNLLFMQQYRDTLRRDDTVSFPQVSEGNARLLSRGVGSPNAWPANWVWSASHDLPVERWDLLSGQRLDPLQGATIDVGDLEQDAAFLLEGWSVRHACGAAICREVEGRAEMVIPLDRAPTRLYLRAVGTGSLRVTLNGGDPCELALGPEMSPVIVPFRRRWVSGPNRIAFEVAPGGRALVDGLVLHEVER
jgi:hypothetical protein